MKYILTNVQSKGDVIPVLQFHGAPDFYEAMLKYLNIVFTTLFSLECILKIIAFGPLVCISNSELLKNE